MKRLIITTVLLFPVIYFPQTKTRWDFTRLDTICGYSTTLFGNPLIDRNSNSISFGGISDGIIVEGNSLTGSSSFTIEIIFHPDSSANPLNKEQRFLHIQNPVNQDGRILIELRLYKNQTWALDGFIKSENSRCTLLDSSLAHPADKWYHAALVYKNGKMKNFVNGKLELEGQVEYLPIQKGKTSLGMRMDKRSFFKGKIKQILFSDKALLPEEFTIPNFVKAN